MLEDGGEQQTCLQFCKWHANTDAGASTKGKVSQRRHLLPIQGVPALRTEDIWVSPDIWQMMENPLTKSCNRTSLEVIAIQIKCFDSPS